MTGKESSPVELAPLDEFNTKLLSHTRPGDWQNPAPAGTYNLVVIGAGTAGLISAAGAAGLGARVALVEKNLMGGDCLNAGCVPSKSILRSARSFADVRDAGDFGVRLQGPTEADFAAVMQRMRRIRSRLSAHDSVSRYREMGIDVFLGKASFSSPHTVEVGGRTLVFKKAVVATGARAVAPPLSGLKEAGFLTNESVFNLTARPARLAVIGAGPLGCELAQAFRRLGSDVFLFDRGAQVLGREDRDAAEIIKSRFLEEGIRIYLESELTAVHKDETGKRIFFKRHGREESIAVDEILLGAGRAPNVGGLNLEAAGVRYDAKKGIEVNDRLQSSNPDIYGAGDVCLKKKFTHTAEASARLVIQNALFFGRRKFSDLVIPWCTYTDPEVAHTGMSGREAAEKGIGVETVIHRLQDVDRAVTDGEEEGFIKVLAKKGSGRILGATLVARHAGETISEITAAITGRMDLKTVSNIIHPYPTQAEAFKRAGDTFNRRRLKPWIRGCLNFFMTWRRR